MNPQETRALYQRKPAAKKALIGVDVFVHQTQLSPAQLAERLQSAQTELLELEMITNRGVKVWPEGFPETFCTDHWRCRFIAPENAQVDYGNILTLLFGISQRGLDVIKTENLCTFDGIRGFALGQGQ